MPFKVPTQRRKHTVVYMVVLGLGQSEMEGSVESPYI